MSLKVIIINYNKLEMNKVIFISLDGNIGCGKTTLLNRLKESMPNVTVIDEPVGQWSTLINDGKSLLELFYEDKARWGYTFQNCAILTRLTLINNILEQVKQNASNDTPNESIRSRINVVISERSILTDKYVFADMLRNSGHINKLEWDLYCKWFDDFGSSCKVDGIIHINTCPETSFRRIQQRNRKGEDNITFDYIQQLDQQHMKWLSETPIHKLSISTEDNQDINKSINKIRKFIDRLELWAYTDQI